MKYHCPTCKKIIVEDIKGYLKKYPEEKWMMCPYCGVHFLTEKISDYSPEEIKKEILL